MTPAAQHCSLIAYSQASFLGYLSNLLSRALCNAVVMRIRFCIGCGQSSCQQNVCFVAAAAAATAAAAAAAAALPLLLLLLLLLLMSQFLFPSLGL